MPRKPIRSRKIARPVLLDFVRILLMDGHQARHEAVMAEIAKPGKVRLSGKVEAFRMAKRPRPGEKDLIREAWETHRSEILRIWKTEKRQGKPWAERIFDNE